MKEIYILMSCHFNARKQALMMFCDSVIFAGMLRNKTIYEGMGDLKQNISDMFQMTHHMNVPTQSCSISIKMEKMTGLQKIKGACFQALKWQSLTHH